MIDKEGIQELAKAQAISAAGVEVGKAMTAGSGPAALTNDFNLHDLEKYMPNRRRVRGSMTTSVIADFATYATKYKEDGAAIFIDAKAMSATAVLNLGTTDKPGHADNTATITAERTAAYTALLKITGNQINQKDVAEFLEDWSDIVKCFSNDSTDILTSKAIAAVRSINIEALRKIGNEVQNLSVSRSAFEKIEATSEHTIPSEIGFRCIPYKDLPTRYFVLRLSILTGGDKPTIVLRIIKAEEHEEQMAGELAGLITDAIKENMPVMIGKYTAKQ